MDLNDLQPGAFPTTFSDIDWDDIQPPERILRLDIASKMDIPTEVLDRFHGNTKGLGKAVKRLYDGRYVVRSFDGVTALYRVLDDGTDSDTDE